MVLAFMIVEVTQSTMVWTLHGSMQMPFPKKYVPKKFHFSLMEFAFLKLNVEFNFFELVQNKSNMLFMFLCVLGKHEDAIHVTCDKIIQVFMKNIVHQMLKDGRAFKKPKGIITYSK